MKTYPNPFNRKTLAILLAVVLLTAMFAAPVYAGVFGKAKDAVTSAAFWGAMSFILGVLGIWLKFDGAAAKKALTEVREVYDVYDKAADPKSPGGAKRTPDEWENIAKESLEALGAILVALPVRWQTKIGLKR